uniref:Uncharacterized protein n=1 Tax=Homalodisca liturata TaxID=320908 RepID=A0A1B6I5Y0_9HEMI
MVSNYSVVLFLISTAVVRVTGEDVNAMAKFYCYQCNSQTDPDCFRLSGNASTTYYKPCNRAIIESLGDSFNGYFCRKISQKIYPRDDLEVIVRSCGYVRHESNCYQVRTNDHRETVCQCFSDGCNPARTSQPARLLLGVATLMCASLGLMISHPVIDIL